MKLGRRKAAILSATAVLGGFSGLLTVSASSASTTAGTSATTTPATPAQSTSSASSSTPIPLTAPKAASTGTTGTPGGSPAVVPLAVSPSGCLLNASGYPHLAASQNYEAAKVFDSTNCNVPVDTIYISVALYKYDFWGSYFENSGSNTNTFSSSVGAGASVTCSNLTQSTTFYGTAYSYDTEASGTYSAEGQGPSQTLKCGTPGG